MQKEMKICNELQGEGARKGLCLMMLVFRICNHSRFAWPSISCVVNATGAG